MIPQTLRQEIQVSGPSSDVRLTLTVSFDPPVQLLPTEMDRVIEQELHNAIVRIMERAKKDRTP